MPKPKPTEPPAAYDPNRPLADDPPALADSAPPLPPPDPNTFVLSLPVYRGPLPGYTSNHVDLRLTPGQAEALRRLAIGLDAAQIRHADGRPLGSVIGEPLRWILGELAAQLAAPAQ